MTAPPTGDTLARSRAILTVTAGLWIANVLIVTAASLASGIDDPGPRLLIRIALALFGCLLCLGMHLVIRALALKRFTWRVLLTLALSLIAAALNLAANSVVIQMLALDTSMNGDQLPINLLLYGFWAWFFLAWAAFYLAIDYGFEARELAEQRGRIEVAAREAQLRALRYQIQPHFLFNTLNSLSALVMDRKPDQAELMIERLSTFLRTTLDDNRSGLKDLAEELTHQRLYLEIEKARRPELDIDIQLPAGLERAQVPDFLLQPLVENAVRHSASEKHAAFVRIAASSQDGRLIVTVANAAGDGRASGFGIGLTNVRERLDLLFGPDASLVAGPGDNGVYEVRLALPLRYAA